MGVIKNGFIYGLLTLMSILSGYAQQDNLLQRKVKLTAGERPLEQVLMELSNNADFTFSYDASIFSDNEQASPKSEYESVKQALDNILPKKMNYRVSGNHLILLRKPAAGSTAEKEKYSISGNVYHAVDATPLKDIVVYEVSSLASSVTDQNGAFSISVPTHFEQLGLSFNQKLIRDTVILIPSKDQTLTLALRPIENVSRAESIKDIPLKTAEPVESLTLVQKLVSDQSLSRTQNVNLVLHKKGQISFLPKWGSNLKMSGLVTNNFSLNILVGYASGVNVIEVGGLFNIIREDVKGVQVGGAGNLVGGDTRGFQMGGVFNHNRGSLVGFQVAGVNNMLVDSLKGVQLAGVSNILKGEMKGAQISGVNNLTTRNVDGLQFAGLTNIALMNVEKVQIAGLFNKGVNVSGVQFAGLVNIASEDIQGLQLSAFVNKARNVNAVQFAGFVNISKGTVSGMQISGILNSAKTVKSSQIGLFNFADSASGTPVGLLSYVRKGYRAIELSSNELMPVNLSVKTGVKRFYNIFSGSYGSWKGERQWAFGYGFGFKSAVSENTFFNVEYTAHWVNESSRFQKDLSLLNKLNINWVYRSSGGMAFSIGPVVNIWLSEWEDMETGEYLTDLAPYTITNGTIGTTLAQLWVGGRVGIQFFQR